MVFQGVLDVHYTSRVMRTGVQSLVGQAPLGLGSLDRSGSPSKQMRSILNRYFSVEAPV